MLRLLLLALLLTAPLKAQDEFSVQWWDENVEEIFIWIESSQYDFKRDLFDRIVAGWEQSDRESAPIFGSLLIESFLYDTPYTAEWLYTNADAYKRLLLSVPLVVFSYHIQEDPRRVERKRRLLEEWKVSLSECLENYESLHWIKVCKELESRVRPLELRLMKDH